MFADVRTPRCGSARYRLCRKSQFCCLIASFATGNLVPNNHAPCSPSLDERPRHRKGRRRDHSLEHGTGAHLPRRIAATDPVARAQHPAAPMAVQQDRGRDTDPEHGSSAERRALLDAARPSDPRDAGLRSRPEEEALGGPAVHLADHLLPRRHLRPAHQRQGL